MKNKSITVLLIVFSAISGFGQPKYSFTNEFVNWRNRTDYYNWKVYISGDSTYLASIKQIEYYLDPTYKNAKRVITRVTGGKNFALCSNGWGEFTLRIKIIFNNRNAKSINEIYVLDLHSPAKRSRNYKCP